MSLTATLLLGQPITLPAGKRRTHAMENRTVGLASGAVIAGNLKNAARCQAIKNANAEAVLDAIRAGSETIVEIADATVLSISTVKKMLHDLEDGEDGPRIRRETAGRNRSHRFFAVDQETA